MDVATGSGSASPLHLQVREESQVGEVRRRAAGLARSAGFDEVRGGRLEIIGTELAKNLLRHAGGGQMVLQWRDAAPSPALDVFAIDRGPGMADVGACLRDGFSTAGTPGTGLGAVRLINENEQISFCRKVLGNRGIEFSDEILTVLVQRRFFIGTTELVDE